MVVGDLLALDGSDHLFLSIDFVGAVTDVQFDSDLFVPFHASQHELFGAAVSEKSRQANSVVGSTRLFAKGDDAILARLVERNQLFAKSQAHHSVANNNDGLTF